MRVALVNPPWSFEGSIYFGCREPHLPLELGYAQALLRRDGHVARIFDAQLFGMDVPQLAREVGDFAPDLTVIATAPSYLFWRCAPPELRVPKAVVGALRGAGGTLVAVGPHGSTTPRAAARKLGVDAVVIGECEVVVAELARRPRGTWCMMPSLALSDGEEARVQGGPAAVDLTALPPLRWSDEVVRRHHHHHHRFDSTPVGPGAEVEASRGCPYRCTFCAKENYRNKLRKRPLEVVLDEIDALVAQGVTYVYFIDEIFMPDRPLLEALVERDVRFGVQMRIDLWSEEDLDLLGRAGCVSVEAGVESLTQQGRAALDKRCRMDTAQLTERLLYAKRRIPFVQANLLDSEHDDPGEVEAWRQGLIARGVWANKPVPLFPYPGSPDYTRRWGLPDDLAWERALDHYLGEFQEFSDIQESRPVRLEELER